MTKIIMIFLLILNPDLFANSKGNRDAYHTYFTARYNKMIHTQNVFGDIFLYSTGHRGRVSYIPRTHPFPEQEALKGAQIRDKYRDQTLKLGDRMDKLNDVINSAFARWTDKNSQEMKALVGDVNFLWKKFGEEMRNTFPPGSVMLNEGEIRHFMDAYSNWKVKTVRDIDKEN